MHEKAYHFPMRLPCPHSAWLAKLNALELALADAKSLAHEAV